MARLDERDIMFARMNYEPGTKAYEDYYQRNPDKLEIDEALRAKPALLSEGTAMYDEIKVNIPLANFDLIEGLKEFCEGQPSPTKVAVKAQEATDIIKKLAAHYGACLCGITKMEPDHYYSHRGRSAYGEAVTESMPYGIVIGVEMDKGLLDRAPRLEAIIESSNIYAKAGLIGVQLTSLIRRLGYRARHHMDGNYLVVAPRVAVSAGLGVFGRHGLVLNETYGSRFRLGVITTDLPLIEDVAQASNLTHLCDQCTQCLRTCPGKAIPYEKKEVEGVLMYQIDHEKCYDRWRSLGTDCGICLSNCPVSQGLPPGLLEKGAYEDIIRTYQEKYGIRPYNKESFF